MRPRTGRQDLAAHGPRLTRAALLVAAFGALPLLNCGAGTPKSPAAEAPAAPQSPFSAPAPAPPSSPYAIVLGISQDGGVPQAGCHRDRCVHAARDPALRRFVACLGLVDPATGQRWLVDATPDLPSQLAELDGRAAPPGPPPGLAGIFLTHAHVGHYTGLMFLGREVIGSRQVPVYAMPRMEKFLRGSGPWNQLIALHNIDLRPLRREQGVSLVDGLTVTPFLVPHRQEYSETVAFRIKGPHRTLAYLPDIDRWEKMDPSIESLLAQVDVAFLDGTFYSGGELPGRNMDEIPHPTMKDTMRRLAGLPLELRRRVRFIHLNHTNPALDTESDAGRWLRQAGFLVARQGEQFGL